MSAFPTVKSPANDNLKSNQPVLMEISGSGKRQSRITAGHLWEYTANYPPMKRATFAPIYAFSAGLRGQPFTITIPNLSAPQGAVTGSININGTEVAGATSINVEGFVANTADVFKAGDILKTSSHSKVYMVTEDASSGIGVLLLEDGVSKLLLEDGASYLLLELNGQATISITPPLIEALTDGVTITYTDVPFTMAFKDDIFEWKTSAPDISSYTINLIEAI